MLCLQWTQYFLNGFTEHLKPQRIASMYFNTTSVMEAIKNHWKRLLFLFSGVWVGVTEHYHIYLSFSNKKIPVAIQHQIKSKYSTSENYRWQGKFFKARLFFVVLGVQNWVPIEHGHIYHIINTSDNTTQRNVKSIHHTLRENYLNASLFVLLFVLLLFFRFNIFWVGGAGGWDWVCFLGGGGLERNAMWTQSIALRSAILGRENLIAGGLFVLFFCLFGVFFGFLFYFYFFGGLVELFSGWWTG